MSYECAMRKMRDGELRLKSDKTTIETDLAKILGDSGRRTELSHGSSSSLNFLCFGSTTSLLLVALSPAKAKIPCSKRHVLV